MIFYFKDQTNSDLSIQAHSRLLLSESVSAKKATSNYRLEFPKFSDVSEIIYGSENKIFKYLEVFKSTCLNQISRFEPDFRGNSHSNKDFEFTSFHFVI